MSTYTRSAIGLLTRQYRSVLKKCFLINCGLFALGAVSAHAEVVLPSKTLMEVKNAVANYSTTTPFELTTTKTDGYLSLGFYDSTAKKNIIYYFNPNTEDKDTLRTLQLVAATGNAFWEETTGDDAVFKIGDTKYKINAANMPTTSYTLTPAEASGANTITLYDVNEETGEITAKYYKLSVNTGNTSGTKKKYFKWSKDSKGNNNLVEVTAENGADVVVNYNDEDIITTQQTSLSGDVNKIFVKAYTGSSGGAIYNPNYSTIGNITGDFIGNYSSYTSYSSRPYVHGGAIYNANNSTIGNITGNFIGNYAYASLNASTKYTATAEGGAIYNDYTIGNITGDFIGNHAYAWTNSTGRADAYGGAYYGMHSYGSITGDFINNYAYGHGIANASAVANGGAIWGYAQKNITGDFIGNYAYAYAYKADTTAVAGAIYLYSSVDNIIGDFIGNYAYAQNQITYSSANTNVYAGAIFVRDEKTIDNITGDFIGNYVYASPSGSRNSLLARGGAIFNSYGGTIGNIEGNFVGNYVYVSGSGSSSNTMIGGGAIFNYYYNTISIVGDFVGNYVKTTSTSQNVYGGAIFNGYSPTSYESSAIVTLAGNTFTSNYTQQGTNSPVPNSIYNAGTINIAENATVTVNDGWQTYIGGPTTTGRLVMLGSSSVLNMNIANGTPQDDSLGKITNVGTINATVDIDVADTSNIKNDTIAVYSVTQAGDMTLTDINFKNAGDSFSGTAQILKLTDATNLLQLNVDDLAAKYATGVVIGTETGFDGLTSGDVQWNKDYGTWTRKTSLKGTLTPATTDTTNDSISFAIEKSVGEKTYNPEGALLAAINQNTDYSDKSFTFDAVDNVFTSGVDLGTTTGTLTVNGVADESGKSTIDLNGKGNFNVADGASLSLNDVTITGDDALDSAGALSLNNATVCDVTTTGGTLSASNGSTLGTLTNEGTATLDNSSATGVDNSGTMTAQNGAELSSVNNSGTLNVNGATLNGNIVNSGTLSLTNATFDGYIAGTGTNAIVNFNSDADLSSTNISNSTINANGVNLTVGSGSFSNSSLNANDGSTINIADNTVNLKNATFNSGSTLTVKVNSLDHYGSVRADTINVESGANLSATLAQGIVGVGQSGTVQLLSADNTDFNNFADSFDNEMYHFEKSGNNGAYNISLVKTAEDVVEEIGGTETNKEVASAWVDGDKFEEGSVGEEVANALADLAQNNPEEFKAALTSLSPNDDSMVQTVDIKSNDVLFDTISGHLHGTSLSGMSSGDAIDGVGIWADAYYGKSKLQKHNGIYGFDSENKGVIVGVEKKKLIPGLTVGAGVHYEKGDIDAFRRDVDLETTKGFTYVEYQPNKWFINGTASYSVTKYDESKYTVGRTIKAKYDVDTYGLRSETGYKFEHFAPELGLRYYRIKRHGYVDGVGQRISERNMDLLRGAAGVRAEYKTGMFKPNAYLGVIYDMISDRDNAVVALQNGTSYTVAGSRMARFGVEANAGIEAQLSDNLKASLNYIGEYREYFQSHAGMLRLRYEF